MKRPALATVLACAAVAVAASGCGGSSSAKTPAQKGPTAAVKPPDPNDKRAVALQCFRDAGVKARLDGEQAIVVSGNGAPRVQFFVSSGEAEARQFLGQAQGAEQIGAALLFINQGTEGQLATLETCLNSQ